MTGRRSLGCALSPWTRDRERGRTRPPMGGWNRMRAGRRLRAWQKAGQIRRNAEEIFVTTHVTPTVTETPRATVTRGSSLKLAAFVVALALACVSAAFSIDGLTAIFAGAFWPVITMGATLEAGKLVAAAWLAENWHSAPFLLRLILVAMIGVLMSLNAVGGLTRRTIFWGAANSHDHRKGRVSLDWLGG